MTLVVTEVSEKYGCVVVGDTAVTIGNEVIFGVRKVHYATDANIGFAIWGNACLAGRRLDEIVSEFADDITRSESPRSAGTKLATVLTHEGEKDPRTWDKLRAGVHVCGYQDGKPVLFHVHTGHELPAPQGPFQLYEDYPDASGGFCQLRNGYYQMFAALFDGMERYAAGLRALNFTWPESGVEDRVSYYSIMVATVARTLEAAGRVQSVGGYVSAFAFNRDGLRVDKRQPPIPMDNFCREGGDMASFGEPGWPQSPRSTVGPVTRTRVRWR
jgi:hypothetical protein